MAFGYHPYFRLPGASRDDVRCDCRPAGTSSSTTGNCPLGRRGSAEDEPIGQRTFDDLYELDGDRELALTAGGRRLVVRLDDGYRYAQVFGPPGRSSPASNP